MKHEEKADADRDAKHRMREVTTIALHVAAELKILLHTTLTFLVMYCTLQHLLQMQNYAYT